MSRSLVAALAFAAGTAAQAQVPAVPEASRGELLYALHCIACHSSQLHWRDRRVAGDWSRLVAEVERWQQAGKLGWERADVIETARYLNTLHYRYPVPENP